MSQQQRSITSFFAKAPATIAAQSNSGSPLRPLSVMSTTKITATKTTESDSKKPALPGEEEVNATKKVTSAKKNLAPAKEAQPATVKKENKDSKSEQRPSREESKAKAYAGNKRKKTASASSSSSSLSASPSSVKAQSEAEPLSSQSSSPPSKRRRRMISSSSSESDSESSASGSEEKLQSKKPDQAKKKPLKKEQKKLEKPKNIAPLMKATKCEQPAKEKAQEQIEMKKQNESLNNEQSSREKKTQKEQNDESDYNPGKARYDPLTDASWSSNEPVPYLALAKTFEAIEATPGRLRILELLCNFLRSVRLLSPNDLLPCVYLCLNQLAPAYEAVELGIGDSVLMKAMALSTGSTVEKIRQRAQAVGDLGAVSESLRSRQSVMCRPKPLTVPGVLQRLREIADLSGNAAQQKKVAKIQSLLVSCRQCEAKYLIRSLSGRLRIGLAELSVLSALGHAFVRSPNLQTPDAARGQSSEAWKRRQDEAALLVRTAYCRCPNYDFLITALLAETLESDRAGDLSGLLSRCQLQVGLPLKPMLAHPTRGVAEVLKRFEGVGAFTCEFKYDGERAQIHRLADGSIRVYSRNQENNTSKYPDIAARVPDLLRSREPVDFILDAEAVAFDTEKRQILPFQVLTTRKRKDADADTIKVQVCVFVFDILYYNGESLVEKPLRERRQVLRDGFNFVETEQAGHFALAKWQDCTDTEEIQGFLDEAICGNCEGLMLKALDTEATYEIAKRSHSWLKLKKDYVDGVGDTLDLVVVGGYHGTGKRAGKLGGFLLACYHPDDEEYQAVCKIGTGFSDEDLDAFTRDLAEHKTPAPRRYIRCGAATTADVWFDPAVVWEVKAADLSLSPAYVAGLGLADSRRGISLRFPRFIRRREDKRPEEATTAAQLADMYRSQEVVKSAAASAGGLNNGEDDYY